jgi:hypothetical protein
VILRGERGVALIVAMMAMLLLAALGAGLVLTTGTESAIAANFRNGIETRYAARAVVERGMADLADTADWDSVLSGLERSTFVNGSPAGQRVLPDGTRVDLSRMIALARCGRFTACSDADMNARTARRPWGTNNPRWQLYAYGYFGGEDETGSAPARAFVALLVGDDGLETDGDPLRDGSGSANAGAGVLSLRAEAFGSRGAHSAIDLIVARSGGAGPLRIVSWREVG